MNYCKISFPLLGLASLFCVAPMAQAQTIIDFEDLNGTGAFTSTYHGIDFEPGVWNYYDSVQPPYTPHSGKERTYQSTAERNPFFTFVTPSIFNGLWVSGQSYASAQLFLYDTSNTLVAQSGIVVGSSTPQFLASGYSGNVKKVVINTPSADNVVFDDLSIGASSSTAVPEPGSVALLVSCSLTGTVLLARRRMKKL